MIPRKRSTRKWALAGSAALVAMIGVAGMAVGSVRAATAKADPKVVAAARELLAEVPAATGGTDGEQIRSLLGAPDAFVVSYEHEIRFETWHYYAARSSIELANGRFVMSLPLDDVASIALLPLQYDPASFQRGMSVDAVKAVLVDPAAGIVEQVPVELGVTVVTLVGEQLFAAFDDTGLLYVETFPLRSGSVAS